MKKILFLGALRSGGAEHQMVIVARLLKDAGYDVTYLCGDSSTFYQPYLEESGIPILRIKESKLAQKLKINTLYVSKKVGEILKAGKYETVISFLGFWNYQNCLYANNKGTKHRAITGIRNNRNEVFLSIKNRYYIRFERLAYCKVSNSNAAKERFAKYYPRLANKLTTIYNIVDLPKITTEYRCLKDNRVNIIVPASYRAVKNPMGTLKAVALLSDENRARLHIDWYGSIKDEKQCYEKMKQFITDNHIEETISLHDATNDIANRINESDVVGLFSTSEGLPNSVCEGMMLGKPVVMTRVSDFEVLAGDGNGVLCDADNPQSIADALSVVSRLTKEDLERMGSKSKSIAISNFSKESVIKQWIEII